MYHTYTINNNNIFRAQLYRSCGARSGSPQLECISHTYICILHVPATLVFYQTPPLARKGCGEFEHNPWDRERKFDRSNQITCLPKSYVILSKDHRNMVAGIDLHAGFLGWGGGGEDGNIIYIVWIDAQISSHAYHIEVEDVHYSNSNT